MMNRKRDPQDEDKPRKKTNYIVLFVVLCLLVAAVVCFFGDDIMRLLRANSHVVQFQTDVKDIMS